jgi:hypothetical protein
MKYCSDVEIKVYEMGGVGYRHRTDNRCIRNSISDIYPEETTNNTVDVNGRIILKVIVRK